MLRLAPLLLIGIAAAAASEPVRQVADPAAFADRPLGSVLAELRELGVDLIYSSELIEPWMRVREPPTAREPVALAREILAPYSLGLEQGPGERWLVVRAPAPPPADRRGVEGVVIDAATGEPVADVRVAAGGLVDTTDSQGRFALAVDLPGALQLVHADYQQADFVIRSAGPIELRLRPARRPIEELTVVASRYRLFGSQPTAEFDHDEIDRLPHLADDIARAIRRLPAASAGDFSAQFHLRGGNRDETLLRLDGFELIDPYHLKDLQGALSIVDSNLVDRVEVLGGGFPADYGDRASGVVDIRTLPPPAEPVHAVGVSFVNAFANTRGSFADQRGGWLVSARRGYLDWLFDLVNTGSGEFTPRYYDLLAKVERDLGEQHTVTGHALLARDDLLYTDDTEGTRSDGEADTLFLWARWQSDWTRRLRSETVLWHGGVDRNRDAAVADPQGTMGNLRDRRETRQWGVRSDWQWQASEDLRLKGGLDLQHHEADYDYLLDAIVNASAYPGREPIVRRSRLSIDGEEFGVYAAVNAQLTGRLSAELGLRWDLESYTGLGEDVTSPRLNLLYRLGPRTKLRAAWGLFHQFQGAGQLQVEDGEARFFPALRAEQAILGVEHEFASTGLALRVEAYQKDYHRLRPRYVNLLGFEVISEAEGDRVRIDAHAAEARGVEITLRRRAPTGWSWWGSYTWAVVEDRVDGRDVPREWDQRHGVNLVANWHGERWNFNVAGRWHSGWPRTDFSAGVVDTPSGPQPGLVFGARNALRYGDYTRVDIRLSREIRLARSQLTYFFELYNVFDAQNQCCFDEVQLLPGSVLLADTEDWLPRVPSFGFTWTF